MFLYQSNRLDFAKKITYSSFVFRAGVINGSIRNHLSEVRNSIRCSIQTVGGGIGCEDTLIIRGKFNVFIYTSPEEPEPDFFDEQIMLVGDHYDGNACSFGVFLRIWDADTTVARIERCSLWRILEETESEMCVSVKIIFSDVYKENY